MQQIEHDVLAALTDRVRSAWQDSSDFAELTLDGPAGRAKAYYLKTLVDERLLKSTFIQPFYQADTVEQYARERLSFGAMTVPDPAEQDAVLLEIMRGQVLLVLEDRLFLLDVRMVKNGKVEAATVESSVYGPKNALTEDYYTNIGMIRLRYPNPGLTVEYSQLGKLSKTAVVMMYDKEQVEDDTLKQVREAVSRVETNMIQSASELHRELTGKKFELFPSLLITERPDRAAHNLMHGKVVLLLNGTPFALVVPSVFYDFMASVDDIYQPWWSSRMLVTLRYIALFVSLTLASFYVAITSYNPEILRVQLTLSIAGSRAPVPYPSYVEVLFMLLMMELLVEASVRLPKSVGPTATTVGGLILGQAATQAGLVSNIMIIIVATVAISNFVIPISSMSYGIRFIRYIFLLGAIFFGIVGILVTCVWLISYATNINQFGQSYLRIYIDKKKGGRLPFAGSLGAKQR